MNYQLHAVKDNVTGRFSEPKLFINEADAKRWFVSLSKESPFAKDLALYKVGDFDIIQGKIEPCNSFMLNGGDIVE